MLHTNIKKIIELHNQYIDKININVMKLDKQIQFLIYINEQLGGNQGNNKSKIKDLIDELSKQDININKIIETNYEKMSVLQKEFESLVNTNTKLTTLNNQLLEKQDELTKENNELTKENNDLTKENNDLTNKISTNKISTNKTSSTPTSKPPSTPTSKPPSTPTSKTPSTSTSKTQQVKHNKQNQNGIRVRNLI